MALEQVTTIRSGYGSIKKIECMEYFINLRELLLCTYGRRQTTTTSRSSRDSTATSNSTSSPWVVLPLASLQQDRESREHRPPQGTQTLVPRYSLPHPECNKIGRNSADYLSHYDWKTLESLTISCHPPSMQSTSSEKKITRPV